MGDPRRGFTIPFSWRLDEGKLSFLAVRGRGGATLGRPFSEEASVRFYVSAIAAKADNPPRDPWASEKAIWCFVFLFFFFFVALRSRASREHGWIPDLLDDSLRFLPGRPRSVMWPGSHVCRTLPR